MSIYILIISLILIFVTLVLYLFLYFDKSQNKENYEQSNNLIIPISLVFNDTLLIPLENNNFDYFLNEKLKDNFDIELKANEDDIQLKLCVDSECKYKYSQEIDTKKYDGPAIINNQIQSGYFINIEPKRENFTNKSINTYISVKIRLILNSFIALNKVVSIKTIYDDALKNNNVQVFIDKNNNNITQLYDLYVCKWNDIKKEALCQFVNWELRNNFPDILIGKSRTFDMIRFLKK